MSETSEMVVRTVRDLVQRFSGSAGDQWGEEVQNFFDEVIENGLSLTLVPECSGGVGFEFEVAAEICRTWGGLAAPLPIVEMMLANQLVASAGRPDLMDKVTLVSGAELFRGQIGQGLVAPWFPGVAYVAVLQFGSDKVQLIDVQDLGLTTDLSGAPFFDIEIEQSPAIEHLTLPGSAHPIEARAAILTASAALGCMEKISAITLEYSKTRVQFGRPLAAFQAIQHMLAEAHSEITLTRGALDQALVSADDIDLSSVEWMVCKVQAARASGLVAAHAHQVLGAIGFTEEHELHHYTKRLWSWRDRCGTQAGCEAALGVLACQAGDAGLWPSMTASRFTTEGWNNG